MEMELGLIDANLRSGIFKKRVAVGGRGKSGRVRVIATREGEGRWFFLFGYKRNELENITTDELRALQEIAEDLRKLSMLKIHEAIRKGVLKEVCL